ncbi:MAG: hypothetical protein KA035_01640 [Candidatus Levybacteria bacterium]|nr:hypothetical protein [Candidatus Levybacteria bacterium]
MKKLKKLIPKNFPLLCFFSVLFIFSYWLMFSTFSYQDGNIVVASKAWSDFGSHIPLIRSFSFGWNFPPEYPLFANEPIHYHFLFYAFVGFLERIGIPLHIALNIPSALLFFALLVMLYVFGKSLFKSKLVGVLSVLFFVCNGSFSFLYFIRDNPITIDSFYKIISSTSFLSFSPYYGDSLVSAFWNLNIYTNQRHLAAAFAFSLFVVYIFLKPILTSQNSKSISVTILLGVLLGCSFYFHLAAFGMTAIVIFILAVLFPVLRPSALLILLLASVIGFPQYRYMNQEGSVFSLLIKPGYLTPAPVTLSSFLNYWTLNLGLHTLLIPVGFLLAPKKIKKIFIAFFAFFVIGNVFQFSPEMAANHKFFNYFMLIGGMFSGYTIYLLWIRNIILKLLAIVLTLLLIMSGVMDFFPIYNDTKVTLGDYHNNPDIKWIMQNTPPDSVFINTSYFVPIESVAGRKILFGWPYFAWSQGYDTNARGQYIDAVLSARNATEFCKIVKQQKADFLRTTNPPDTGFPMINPNLLHTLTPVYKNSKSGVTIYDITQNCTQ